MAAKVSRLGLSCVDVSTLVSEVTDFPAPATGNSKELTGWEDKFKVLKKGLKPADIKLVLCWIRDAADHHDHSLAADIVDSDVLYLDRAIPAIGPVPDPPILKTK